MLHTSHSMTEFERVYIGRLKKGSPALKTHHSPCCQSHITWSPGLVGAVNLVAAVPACCLCPSRHGKKELSETKLPGCLASKHSASLCLPHLKQSLCFCHPVCYCPQFWSGNCCRWKCECRYNRVNLARGLGQLRRCGSNLRCLSRPCTVQYAGLCPDGHNAALLYALIAGLVQCAKRFACQVRPQRGGTMSPAITSNLLAVSLGVSPSRCGRRHRGTIC